MNVNPDGFMGASMAIEGISDACVVLHGPNGCKRRVRCFSNKTCPRAVPLDHLKFSADAYDQSSRIPGSELDTMDAIYGSMDKLALVLDDVEKNDDALIAILTSPGFSLIGEDYNRIINKRVSPDRIMTLDTGLYSKYFGEGWDSTIVRVLEHLSPEKKETIPHTVNLLGTNILSKDWKYAISEITKMLNLIGIDVISMPGAGSSISDLKNSINAEKNILICPEMGSQISQYYESKFGIPYLSISESPIGFDGILNFFVKISEFMGVSADPVINQISDTRKEVYGKLIASRDSSRVRGRTFAISGFRSDITPLTKWLFEYLSMVPTSVQIIDDNHDNSDLESFLEKINSSGVLGSEIPEGTEYILADGYSSSLHEISGKCLKGIPIRYPYRGIDIMPHPVWGLTGAKNILDLIFNVWC